MTLEFTGTNVKVNELNWQKAGLSYTATGYGEKIATRYMVWYENRWRRVYVRQFSNAGTLFIVVRGEKMIVNIQTDHLVPPRPRCIYCGFECKTPYHEVR